MVGKSVSKTKNQKLAGELSELTERLDGFTI